MEDQSISVPWKAINRMNETIETDFSRKQYMDLSLAKVLFTWANEYKIKHNTWNLLKLLQKHGHNELPSTAWTLLQTPQDFEMRQLSGMEYISFPLKQKLQKTLDFEEVAKLQFVDLSFNVDGLPLYKSSKTCMWPVLCAVMLEPVTIFPTTLTCGVRWPGVYSKKAGLTYCQLNPDLSVD